MKNRLFNTTDSWTMIVLRVILGLVILPHGAQKLLGWFGGYGFTGTMNFFTGTVGLPWIIGFLVIIIEFFGSILLIAGIGTRIIAASYIVLAIGIAASSHIQNGFFINWGGSQAGEGFEYFILWIALSIALLINGGGKYSADKLFLKAGAA
ncbi:MAG: DoxX family protein [Chitinophagaceae bacterium]